MTIVFTPSGGSATTLVDDINMPRGHIEQLGGKSVVNVIPLANGTNPYLQLLGNVSGEFVFTGLQSFATRILALSQFATWYNLLNDQGLLVVTQDSHTLTFANAALHDVRLVKADGLAWTVRFSFLITTTAYA